MCDIAMDKTCSYGEFVWFPVLDTNNIIKAAVYKPPLEGERSKLQP